MHIDINQLRQLKTQDYEPTQFEMSKSYLEEYNRKDFSEENLAEIFHENTKHTRHQTFKLGPSAAMFSQDPSFAYMQAALKPDYGGKELIDLPEPGDPDASVTEALGNRRSTREFSGEGVTLQQLSTLLGRACGVTGERDIARHGDETVTQTFRAYASAGALYPVEIYFAVFNEGEDLPVGLYYYIPDEHGVRVISTEDPSPKVNDLFTLDQDVVQTENASVAFFFTAAFWRARAKYGPRSYRYMMQESGHLVQNILLVASAMDIGAVPLAGFHDSNVNDYLDVDGVNEAVIYTACLGYAAEHDHEHDD